MVLISGSTRLGEALGRLLATGQGVAYWDSPLMVAPLQSTPQFCSETPKLCARELGAIHSVSLLSNLFHCQLRFITVFQVCPSSVTA